MTGPTDEGKPFDGFKTVYPDVRGTPDWIKRLPMWRQVQLFGYGVVEVAMPTNGAEITLLGYNEADAITPEAMALFASRHRMDWVDFTPEPKEETMVELHAPQPSPVQAADPAGSPPRALSNNMTHRHFHPSYMRVGVRIDGVERNDLKWFDMDSGKAITTDGVMIASDTIEPFWRYAESRQMRRARERWEAKHK